MGEEVKVGEEEQVEGSGVSANLGEEVEVIKQEQTEVAGRAEFL